jgi:hypothetical protein
LNGKVAKKALKLFEFEFKKQILNERKSRAKKNAGDKKHAV